MKVTKMHALGNNYIYISEFEERLDESTLPELAVALSDVRRGIGSDGMILVGPSEVADVRMRIFNADGSEAENCGNGLRCVAKYAFDRGYVSGTEFNVEYKTGVARAFVHVGENRQVQQVTIDMGAPVFGANAVHCSEDVPSNARQVSVDAGGVNYTGWLVSMGNPHFVTFVNDAVRVPVERHGPPIERHPWFLQRLNVEFVTPIGRNELDFRVWERGSGITFACGTGACASVAAGIEAGLLDHEVTVHLLGGDLVIAYRDNRIFMTGEAVEVMTGDFHFNPAR